MCCSGVYLVYSRALPHPALHSTLTRATAALEKGRGKDAAHVLGPVLRKGGLTREDELSLRCALAEAWLLQDDLTQASSALGRPPDALREEIGDARLSALWRL